PPGTTRSAAPPRPRPGNSRGSRPRLREDRRRTPPAATIHPQSAPARRPASPDSGVAARRTETAGRRATAKTLRPAPAARTTGLVVAVVFRRPRASGDPEIRALVPVAPGPPLSRGGRKLARAPRPAPGCGFRAVRAAAM